MIWYILEDNLCNLRFPNEKYILWFHSVLVQVVYQRYTAASIIHEFCSWRLSIKIGRVLIIALSIALFINLCIHDRDWKGEKWIKAFSLCVFRYLLTLCLSMSFGETGFYFILSVILSVYVIYLLKSVQNYNTPKNLQKSTWSCITTFQVPSFLPLKSISYCQKGFGFYFI